MEGIDFAQILRLLAAMAFVLALMGGLAWMIRKLNLHEKGPKSGKKRRLGIRETLALDSRHRAVILSCDEKEHLVILGPNGETIVDNNLKAPK